MCLQLFGAIDSAVAVAALFSGKLTIWKIRLKRPSGSRLIVKAVENDRRCCEFVVPAKAGTQTGTATVDGVLVVTVNACVGLDSRLRGNDAAERAGAFMAGIAEMSTAP